MVLAHFTPPHEAQTRTDGDRETHRHRHPPTHTLQSVWLERGWRQDTRGSVQRNTPLDHKGWSRQWRPAEMKWIATWTQFRFWKIAGLKKGNMLLSEAKVDLRVALETTSWDPSSYAHAFVLFKRPLWPSHDTSGFPWLNFFSNSTRGKVKPV